LICLATLTHITNTYSWNESGHQVVAALAWDNLSEKARKNIIAILKEANPDTDIQALFDDSFKKDAEKAWFMKVAYWPDIVRDKEKKERYEKYHRSHWHYIERYWEQSPLGGVDMTNFPQNPENSVERIRFFKNTLADYEVSNEEKAIQIAWMLHLVGDVHQPLHNGSLVTKKHPGGDKGGNDFRLGDEWPKNLHSYWDGILDIEYGLTYPNYEFDEMLKIAKKISKEHKADDMDKKTKIDDPMKWSDEGARILKISVYPPYLKEGEKPSEKYQENVYKHSSYHIALAGYRLAELLNDVFG